MPDPRALVLGGSGHIGSAIVRQLVAEGWSVTVASRQRRRPRSLADLPVTLQRADGHDPQAIAAMPGQWDLIVDAAAPYPLTMLNAGGGLMDAARERTRALLQLARANGATLVYIGSYVTERRASGGARWLQGNAFRRMHPYFAVKTLIVDELMAARDARVILVNPSVCFGPWDSKPPEQCLMPQLLLGRVPAVARRTINVVDVRDVALAVVGAHRQQRLGAAIAVRGHNIALLALSQQICALRRRPAPRLQVSASASAWLSTAVQLSYEMVGLSSPIPALAMVLLCESGALEMTGVQRALGVIPRPLASTLMDAHDWYQRIGYC